MEQIQLIIKISCTGLGKIGVNLKLITEVLNVAYDEVESVIPKLWSDHNPDVGFLMASVSFVILFTARLLMI